MFIKNSVCVFCESEVVVDTALWESGIDLRCTDWGRYFAEPEARGDLTAEHVCKASVSISVWIPIDS